MSSNSNATWHTLTLGLLRPGDTEVTFLDVPMQSARYRAVAGALGVDLIESIGQPVNGVQLWGDEEARLKSDAQINAVLSHQIICGPIVFSGMEDVDGEGDDICSLSKEQQEQVVAMVAGWDRDGLMKCTVPEPQYYVITDQKSWEEARVAHARALEGVLNEQEARRHA